jgi:hypothetical protein
MGTLAAGTQPGGTVGAFAVTIAGIFLYWLPSLIAWRRRVPGLGQVVIWNFFTFFFVFPWVIALILAFREPLSRTAAASHPPAPPPAPPPPPHPRAQQRG